MSLNINNYDIVFLSLARNCEKTVEIFFNFLEDLEKNNYKVLSIVGENNSEDLTFDKLRRYSETSNLLRLLDTTFIEKFNDRIIRLSKARQYLKNYLEEKRITSKYVCVIDLDEVISEGINYKEFITIKETLDKGCDKLFGISVKTSPYYYDILNYEDKDNINLNILKLQNTKDLFSYFERKKKIYNLQKKITSMDESLSISSFNGLCLYLYEDYINGFYFQEKNNNPIPEHLNLNRLIKNKTKKDIIFLNKLIFRMPEEHRPIFSFIHFLINKFTKYMNLYIKKIND